MNDHETDVSSTGQTPPAGTERLAPRSIGEQLAEVRQAKGWTVEQVSYYLKLAPRQIEAIESDNMAALPAMAVTLGFVRSYAKLLGMDSGPLLARMEASIPPQPFQQGNVKRARVSTFSDTARGPTRAAGMPRSGWIAVVAAVVAIAAIGFGASRFQSLMPGMLSKPAVATTPTSPVGNPTEPAAPRTVIEETTAPVAASPATSTADAPAAVVAPVAGAAQSETVPAQAGADGATEAVAGNLLELMMKKDSWLEIRRVDTKEIIASRLVKGGTIETFEIDSPVNLKIGNASAVDARFRGSVLDLQSAATGNVARLTLK